MAKLQRIHSMTKRSIAMGDTDIERVAVELEAIMSDEHFAGHPALRECMLPGGWLPIASVLNYTPLGRAVWPYGGVGVVGDCLTTRGSLVVELSGDRMCVRSKPLRVQLREQLEFVFSDTNYPKDMHLQLLEDAEGFAKLDVVCSTYTQTRMLLNPVPTDAQRAVLVREAVESSSELIFKPPSKPQDGMGFVRRMTLSEKIRSQVEFYLEQERMASDRFLIEQARDHDGYVPIATILSFPRMRKLVHPQVAAVAHVLSKSAKVEVSADRTLVRPRVAPPESPARASVPTGTARAQVLLVLERLLSDASLTLDRRMQAAIVAHSPADALRSGGSGVRLPVEEVLLHPDVARVLGAAGAMGDGAAELLGQPHPPGSSAGAAAALLRKKLVGLLPQVGESSLLCLSADGAFVERLVPTPEVRQLRSAEPAGVRASGTPAPPSVPPDFSLMTYNLLADMLCTVEQFPEVNVDALDWAHRRPLIEKEIVFHSPDLLCVQELQGTAEGKGEGDHRAELSAALSAHGYEHRYVRKVKRDGSSWPGPQIGNAIFWRSATFEYVEHEEVLIAPLLNGACDDEISRAYFCRGAQVGLVLVLRHRATGRTVVAVTTHLSCNFQEPVTQIAQIHQVLTVAAGVVERHEGAAVVLGADLNSIPGSGCYQLLTAGTLHTAHPHMHIVHSDVRMPSFGDYGGDGDPLYHPLGLQSAYTHLLGQEPLFTNFTGPPSNFVGTLDYIMHSANTLVAKRVLELPSEDTVRKEKCLPSSRFPSDHLPLLAEFTLRELRPGRAALPRPIQVHTALAGAAPEAVDSPTPTDMLVSPKRSREGVLISSVREQGMETDGASGTAGAAQQLLPPPPLPARNGEGEGSPGDSSGGGSASKAGRHHRARGGRRNSRGGADGPWRQQAEAGGDPASADGRPSPPLPRPRSVFPD